MPSFIKILLPLILVCSVVSSLLLSSCQRNTPKQVFYLNSYHQGYGPSGQVMQGIKEVLDSGNVAVEVFFMDTKRKSSPNEIAASADAAVAKIKQYQPDVIIASDDDAVKYVVVPHFKNKEIHVVFCGVNWSAKAYGLPTANITGMLEILPLRHNLQTIKKYYPAAQKLTVLSENSVSEQKNTQLLDTLYRNLGFTVQYRLVNTYAEWQKAFVEANNSADIIYLPTNGAIKNWPAEEAKTFVAANIRKPVITSDDFMMPYAVFGLTKVAREQGIWAARTALKIMRGQKPSAIALTQNNQSKAWLNPLLANKINFKPDTALLARTEKVN